MNRAPRVAVVIPTLNGGDLLERLLDAIQNQEAEIRPEIVAIDSGSTDGTRDLLARRRVRTLTIPRHRFNHGETRNAALARIHADLAVLMVQDAVPADRWWLAALVRPFAEDASLAGTYARQQPWSAASRITTHYVSRWVAAQPQPRVVGPLSHSEFDAMTPIERHIACTFDNVCSCIRMSVWRSHPFRTVRIAEDLEWALEVLQSGHRLAFVPDAIVWHSHERSIGYELQRAYVVHQRLQALFGLSTVPSIGALTRAVASTLPVHLRLAAGEPCRRGRALARAAGLAVALPLGQYLGARAAREGREFLDVRGV